MASLSKSYTLFGFTSPRTIEKIVPEIRLLCENYTNKEWSEDTQRKYFDLLFDSEFYEGSSRPSDTALAARDRITRAPKSLGFVNLKPKIEITAAGAQLLAEKRTREIFIKQLLKFQLPSPYHTQSKKIKFNVKPYLELLRLTNDLEGLSKFEISIFFLQLTDFNNYELIKNQISEFRKNLKNCKTNKKLFIDGVFEKEIHKIFKEKIDAEEFHIRESSDESIKKFIATKKANMRDYADAFIRYLRSTQLISFEANKNKILISDFYRTEVDFILKEIDRSPKVFKTEKEYKEYLFSLDSVRIEQDDESKLNSRIKKLESKLNLDGAKHLKAIDEKKDYLDFLEAKQKDNVLTVSQKSLKSHEKLEEILDVFGVANVVGGTIVIPHTRRALEYWEMLMDESCHP